MSIPLCHYGVIESTTPHEPHEARLVRLARGEINIIGWFSLFGVLELWSYPGIRAVTSLVTEI
ncbi:hypothetical protein ACFLTO_04805 [Chloroflexota bacterium]